MIKAVLIDIDDTIFDFEKCSKNAFLKTLEKFDLKFKEEDFSYFNQVDNILWNKQKLGQINIDQVFKERSALMSDYFKLNMDNSIFNEIFVDFLNYETVKLDGIEDLLVYLSNKYKIYGASNGIYTMQVNRLKKSNLYKYFNYVFVSDKISYEKPDIRFFQKIMEFTKLETKELIMIGDSIKSDIKGASNANIKNIWFNKNKLDYKENIYDYEVLNLIDIKKLL